MANLTIREINGAVVFTAKIVPGSSKTAISGLLGGVLKIKVSAPAEKGKANKCLLEFLAKRLGVKKNAVSLISGRTNPVKRVQVLGITGPMLLERLNVND